MDPIIIAFFVVRQKNSILMERRGQYIGIPGIEVDEVKLAHNQYICESADTALKNISFPAPLLPPEARTHRLLGRRFDHAWNDAPAHFVFYEIGWEVLAPTHRDAFFVNPEAEGYPFDITVSILNALANAPKMITGTD